MCILELEKDCAQILHQQLKLLLGLGITILIEAQKIFLIGLAQVKGNL